MKQKRFEKGKEFDKLERLGLQEDIIKYLMWMKFKNQIALKRLY